jgi:chemotaxis protein CheD
VGKLIRANNASIRMGEMSVAAGPERLRTLLGSCIGLALHDRRLQVGGLAHIVLPHARGESDRPGKFADTAIPRLIGMMEKLTSRRLSLTAKIAGGASMFSTTGAANIGRQNIASCEKILGDLGIPIVGRHCGGEQGRRMALDTSNGKVVIEIVGQDPIEL